MRSDGGPVFGTCWMCPGHDKSETGPVINVVTSLDGLVDSVRFDTLCVVLAGMWSLQHGPKPERMTVHIGPCTGGPADKRIVTLSAVQDPAGGPGWEG